MKKTAAIALIIAAACLSGGCSTQPQKLPLQQILSVILPADFTGDYHLQHTDALNVGVDITFTGLRWDSSKGLWVWTGMVYEGHSPWTNTKAQLTPIKTSP